MTYPVWSGQEWVDVPVPVRQPGLTYGGARLAYVPVLSPRDAFGRF